MRPELRRVLRYLLVGLCNTLVYYAFYLALRLVVPYVVAHVIAYVASVVVAFVLTARFTFGVRATWRRALVFPLAYVLNICVSTACLVVLVQVLGVDKRVAPLIAALPPIPLTYLVTKVVMTHAALDRRARDKAVDQPGDANVA